MRVLSVALVLAAASGCADSTALVVTVDGDLEPGTGFDELRISLARASAQVWSERYGVAEGDGLPLTYRIDAPSEHESLVDVRVEAILDGHVVLEVERETSFVTGESVTLEVCLWQRCVGAEDDPLCRSGSCEAGGGDGDADQDLDVEGDAEGDAESDADVEMLCSDRCLAARDGLCSDGGEGSTGYICGYGADCTDCGPRDPAGCIPHCEVRECGDDGCGGTCPPGCEAPEECAVGGVCVEWVELRPEEPFLVGSPSGEVAHRGEEVLHEVELTHGFVIPAVEFSQRWYTGLYGGLYDALDHSGYPACGLDCPMDNISWIGAAYLTTLMSHFDGLDICYECTLDSERGVIDSCRLHPIWDSPYECEGYRLPTEAEWEYAARGGTLTATYNGDLEDGDRAWTCEPPSVVLDPIAWFCGNSGFPSEPSPGGLKLPNAFGLYDMLGSLHEYVGDWYGDYPVSPEPLVDPFGPPSGEQRIMKGGSYYNHAGFARAAMRWNVDADEWSSSQGFRPVRTVF